MKHGDAGERRIRTLLIANRGEIAVRIARTARSMGITTVAVYSDADAEAVHVSACDTAVALHGTTPGESYLDVGKLIAAARTAGADAVHPGYGFLSENAGFATSVIEAGLTWVGPSPESISVMGDKIAAKRLMEEHGVPVLPSVTLEGDQELGSAAASLTFPIIVKAAAGGGGKGMRVVEEEKDLAEAVQSCRREAGAAFADDRVFLERFLPQPRHVEVQIMGDTHGEVVHLFERECSVQRRHQKVVEESPAPGLDPALRAELCESAVRAGKALGYVGAGTVEFVVGSDGSAAFLEVNTRIQVEHPITEAVTGQDLVRLQLLVAEGRPLPLHQDEITCTGHAVEARLYAEDPENGYLPAAGTLHVIRPGSQDLPAGEARVRWDSGVRSGSVISPHYDPMLAKVIAHAPSRDEALAVLGRELRTTHLQGPATNRDLLCAVLEHPDFVAGKVTTAFLGDHFPSDADRAFAPDEAAVADAAVIVALVGEERRTRGTIVPSGWRNVPTLDQRVEFRCGEQTLEVGYRRERDGTYVVRAGDRTARVTRYAAPVPGQVALAIDDRRITVRVSDVPDGFATRWEVTGARGHVSIHELPRFAPPAEAEVPGATRAPMHGTVTTVDVAVGDLVAKGDRLCVVEAMKMEHRLTAPHAGTVSSVAVKTGDQVAHDEILVIIDEEAQA